MPNQYTRRPAYERFWPKVKKDGPVPAHRPELGPCWLWRGARMTDGRGQFHFEGRTAYAATVAYILTYGPPPEERPWVLHKCDGGRLCCVRPDHLFAGTHADNMADMARKGRHGGKAWMARLPERVARGPRHGSRTRPERISKGSHRPSAKLTESIVSEARVRYAAGGITMQALADWAGVTLSVMQRAIRCQTWTHVAATPAPGTARANSIAAHQRRQREAPTDIERALMRALDAAGVAYEYQFVVGDRYMCDFGFPDAGFIVEADGWYWHQTDAQKARDAAKDAYVRAHGFTVIRLTEHDITQRLDWCLRQIQTHLSLPQD